MKKISGILVFALVLHLSFSAIILNSTASSPLLNFTVGPTLITAQPTNLKAKVSEPAEEYQVQAINQEPFDGNIKIAVQAQKIIVTGCNIHRSTYRLFEGSTDQFGFDPFSSTEKACPQDRDLEVISQLQIASSLAKKSQNIYFYDALGQELLSAKRIEQPILLSGNYSLKVENTPSFSIEGNTIQIKGCNTHNFQFLIVDGELQLSPGKSTRIACPIDNDSSYIQALQRSTKMTKNSQGNYEFYNKVGVLILNAIKSGNSLHLHFPSLTLNVLDVVEGSLSLLGCNTHRFKYQAFDSGRILFGPSTSTWKSCIDDYDHIFLSSLLMSTTIDNKENTLTFYNQAGQILVSAEKILPKPVTFEGKYKMEVVSSSLEPLIVTVDKNSLTFIGCNTNTNGYKAWNNGSISFTPGISTLKACPKDYDFNYSSVLLSVRSYENTPSGLILRNEGGKIVINLLTDLVLKTPIPLNQRTLIGDFTIRLSGQSKVNPDITISITPESININGCNSNTASYDIYADATFKLGPVASTRKACPNDVDINYISAFEKATKLTKSDNGLILSNSQGDLAFLTSAAAAKQAVSAERYYYSLTDSYRQFEGKFIVRAEDEVIPRIKAFVVANYGHFLDQSRIIAAVRWYLLYDIRYEVLFRALESGDTFNVVMDYNPQKGAINLQSLVLMDFTVLPISNENCKTMDKSRCAECLANYGLFRGRCHKVQPECQLYDPEECFKCAQGYILSKGKCLKMK